MLLIHPFYQKCIVLAKSADYWSLPLATKDLFFDPTFTPISPDSDIKEMLENDGGYAYRYLLREIYDDERELNYICNSSDIDEDPIHGEFNYYIGFIGKSTPFLFMVPPFPWVATPTYLTIFNKHYQIEVKSDAAEITIMRTNLHVRDSLLLEDYIRKPRMIEILKNSDRPRLDIVQTGIGDSAN